MNASLNEKLGTVKWGEFKLGDLFEVVSYKIFATLQFSVNEVLRQLLPTKERNLCVIHPIAVYYGN